MFCAILCTGAYAATPESFGDIPPPPTAEQLKEIKKGAKPLDSSVVPMPVDIRKDAMREAALSYGARGGLAWRTYHIREEMETRARYLDKVYDFRQLLIAAPSGMLIEPPIISENIDAMVIEQGGQNAAVADWICVLVATRVLCQRPEPGGLIWNASGARSPRRLNCFYQQQQKIENYGMSGLTRAGVRALVRLMKYSKRI